jgi:aminocarboxymuconate-semialdehyde decarboxylase
MERVVKRLGLKAVAIPSNIRGKAVDEFEPFWAMAEELDVPVYIHPMDPVSTQGRPYEGQYDLIHNLGWPFETTLMLNRLVFSGIMERYPKLKVVSHHMGGMVPFFLGRTEETYERGNQKDFYGGAVLNLEKPVGEYFRMFYYDTAIGGSGPAVRCAYESLGPNCIVFATDSPWGPGTGEFRLRDYPKMIKALHLPEKDEGKIFYENAQRMLGL